MHTHVRDTRTILALCCAAGVASLSACAGGGQGAAGAPAPTSTAGQTAGQAASAPASATWPIKTREHVDLWLHGFAMVQPDSARVPLFRRGYRDQLVVARNSGNVRTLLDTNRDALARRFTTNPSLTGAQFLILYAESWDDMRQAANLFLNANGDPRRATSQQAASIIATFAQSFPSAADRDWLQLFMQSLDDERTKFYHDYWVREQQNRAGVLTTLDTLWQQRYRPKLQRFLNNTEQANGDFIVSLPLDGEGRTVSGGKQQNIVTVNFPATVAEAPEAIYTFAHEAVGTLAASTVNDNTTPADKRNGVADRLHSMAAVRGGYLLLQRTAPELADGYARYYLRSAGVTPGTDLAATFATAFPLPDNIRDAIARQVEIVLGGI
jgi:hypothetical protein